MRHHHATSAPVEERDVPPGSPVLSLLAIGSTQRRIAGWEVLESEAPLDARAENRADYVNICSPWSFAICAT